MTRWLWFFICASLSGSALSQQTDMSSSESLLKPCQAGIRYEEGLRNIDWEGIACVAYLGGFRDALTGAQAIPAVEICIPPQATNGQLIRVVVKYFEQHPERLHHPKGVGVTTALMRAYP